MKNVKEQLELLYNKFIKMSKEERSKYIQEVMNKLDNSASVENLMGFKIENGKIKKGNIAHGYINSKTKLTTAIFMQPFYMDSPEAYLDILEEACQNKYNSIYDFLAITDLYMKMYFGILEDKKGTREDVYTKKRDRSLSIHDFAHLNVAKCSEKSALMQNIFSMLGLESYLIFGELDYDNGKSEDAHAYILIENEDELILYDPQNPFYIVADNKKDITKLAPAIASVGRNINIHELETIAFQPKDVVRNILIDETKQIVENQPIRKYRLPAYLNKKSPAKKI